MPFTATALVSDRGYAAVDFQPIDLALWTGPFWSVRGDVETARLLLSRGAAYDLVIAAALGDLESVRSILDSDPARIAEARPCGKRACPPPWSSATPRSSSCYSTVAPIRTAPEGANAPREWHCTPPRPGDRQAVELLLAAGADPNSYLDSAGNATYVARTPELRALLFANGGTLDPYDLVWLGEDDEAVRRVSADPASANPAAAVCSPPRPRRASATC